MFLRLLLLFTLVPLLEMYLLVKLGTVIGVGWTIALVVGTGVAGAWLARRQGLTVMREIRRDLESGRLPAGSVIDGLLILIAGAVLLTPGMITDAVGFALLIPPCRTVLRKTVTRVLENQVRADSPVVIDGEWRREEE